MWRCMKQHQNGPMVRNDLRKSTAWQVSPEISAVPQGRHHLGTILPQTIWLPAFWSPSQGLFVFESLNCGVAHHSWPLQDMHVEHIFQSLYVGMPPSTTSGRRQALGDGDGQSSLAGRGGTLLHGHKHWRWYKELRMMNGSPRTGSWMELTCYHCYPTFWTRTSKLGDLQLLEEWLSKRPPVTVYRVSQSWGFWCAVMAASWPLPNISQQFPTLSLSTKLHRRHPTWVDFSTHPPLGKFGDRKISMHIPENLHVPRLWFGAWEKSHAPAPTPAIRCARCCKPWNHVATALTLRALVLDSCCSQVDTAGSSSFRLPLILKYDEICDVCMCI